MFTRKAYLLGLSAATTLASVGFVRHAGSAAPFTYKLGHDMTAEDPLHIRNMECWEAVKRETNGQLDVQVFGNYALGTQDAMFSQMRLGSIQFLSTIGQVYSSVVPVSAIDSVGFAFTSAPKAWSVMRGPLGDYLNKEFEAKGIKRFKPVWDLGLRQVTSSSTPIRTVSDFQGFKIRSGAAKIAIDMFKSLGAAPVSLSGNEVYTAMQTHIVDGAEAPLSSIWTYKWWEVQKYVSITNHMYTGEYLTCNLDAWRALPANVQGVVERNVAKYAALECDDTDKLNNGVAAGKLRGSGIQINEANVASMRAPLRQYYITWKGEFGPTVWGLLEQGVGKLGA